VRSNQTCTMDVAGAQIAFSVVAGAGPWPWPGQSGCPSCGPGPGGDPLRLDLAGSVLDATTGSREPIAITLVASSSGPLMREAACAP